MSAFTWQITHKIDENVDTERDYIVEDVQWACPEARHRVIEGFSTSYRSRNGGGDNIVTDGHLPVIDLREVPSHTTTPMTSDASATGRPRPASLVFGVTLPLVWALCAGAPWVWHHVATGNTSGAQLSLLPWLGSASLPIAWVLGTVMMGVLICSAVATWRGHPRGRVIFEAALLTHITITGIQIETSSHTMTSMLTMMCSVLALVAVTSQRSRQWSAQTKAAALKLQESESCKSETAGIKSSDDGYLAAEQVDVGTRRVLAPVLTQSTNGTRRKTSRTKPGRQHYDNPETVNDTPCPDLARPPQTGIVESLSNLS